MSARDLLFDLPAQGLTMRVDEGRLVLSPAEALTADLRASLVAHKPELVALMEPADSGAWGALEAAVAAACEARQDSDGERRGILLQARLLTVAHQLDLAAHFRQVAREWSAVRRGEA